MKFFFENLNLDKWFQIEQIVYNDGTLPGKPQPDIYLKAVEVIKVNISECVVFEDAKSGSESAKRAGAEKIVGVTSMLDENILLSLGASTTILNYSEKDKLHDILQGQPHNSLIK